MLIACCLNTLRLVFFVELPKKGVPLSKTWVTTTYQRPDHIETREPVKPKCKSHPNEKTKQKIERNRTPRN